MTHVHQVMEAGAAWVKRARRTGVDREFAFAIFQAICAHGNLLLAAYEDQCEASS